VGVTANSGIGVDAVWEIGYLIAKYNIFIAKPAL